MIFKPELARKSVTGEKTMTRRLVKEGERLVVYPDGRKAVVSGNSNGAVNGRIKWITGQTYAIQPGRTKPAIGRFRLLDIRRERVRDISEEDAIAEGFGSINEFFDVFEGINGKGSLDNEVWVLVYEAVK